MNSSAADPIHAAPDPGLPTRIRKKPANGWMRLPAVIDQEGPERAHFLIEQLLEDARAKAASICRFRPTPAT